MGPLRGPGSEGSEGSEGGGWRLRRRLKKRGAAGAAGCVEGLWYRPLGDEYKVSVTGLAFCIIWYNNHSADWLVALATPYPAAPLDTPSV